MKIIIYEEHPSWLIMPIKTTMPFTPIKPTMPIPPKTKRKRLHTSLSAAAFAVGASGGDQLLTPQF